MKPKLVTRRSYANWSGARLNAGIEQESGEEIMTAGMTIRWLFALGASAAVSFALARLAMAQPAPGGAEIDQRVQEPLPAPASQGGVQATVNAQPLEDGPVHEAFAEPLTQALQNGIVVDQQPPEAIDEIPPAYQPEGEAVEWIPGYWMWSPDQNDFIWISGVWRDIPPGRMWTPGHWSDADSGYRWVNGFWSDANVQNFSYLPYPPESLEQGPTSPAPSDNYFWIPGCWSWESNRYSWTPGYWYPGQQNWIWVPNHYSYTPRGAIFIRGYWDYPIQNRGLLYAPVYWPGGYTVGYRYTPNYAINTSLLLSSLFIDRDRGYYYYGRGYRGRDAYIPWWNAGYGRGNFSSPLYGFYAWQYGRDSRRWSNRFDWDWDDRDRRGGDRDWDGRRRGDRNDFDGRDGRRHAKLVDSVDEIRRNWGDRGDGDRQTFRGFRELDEGDRQAARQRSQQFQQYRAARANFEAQAEAAPQARLDRGRGDGREGGRARVEVPENFRPPTFDLDSVEGGQAVRRRALEQSERYRQQRDQPREQQVERTRGDRPDVRQRFEAQNEAARQQLERRQLERRQIEQRQSGQRQVEQFRNQVEQNRRDVERRQQSIQRWQQQQQQSMDRGQESRRGSFAPEGRQGFQQRERGPQQPRGNAGPPTGIERPANRGDFRPPSRDSGAFRGATPRGTPEYRSGPSNRGGGPTIRSEPSNRGGGAAIRSGPSNRGGGPAVRGNSGGRGDQGNRGNRGEGGGGGRGR